MLDEKRTASLAPFHRPRPREGIAWGQTVADAILAWRSADGFTPPPPPFTGGTNPGQWRPTPPAFLPGAGPQFATMVPWSIESPSQFRPSGPPALDSARYASDFNETQLMGSLTSAVRTADQTLFSQFWAASTAPYYWNQIAVVAGFHEALRAEEGASARAAERGDGGRGDRLLGREVHYVFWRPVTAIRPRGSQLGAAARHAEPSGVPLRSFDGEQRRGGGARDRFGEHGLQRNVRRNARRGPIFANFSSALDEIKNARIYAGIHFRSACDDGGNDRGCRGRLRPRSHGAAGQRRWTEETTTSEED